MAIAGHIDVRETVVVEVADGHAEKEGAVGVNFALGGHVSKRAIAIVAVERGLRRLARDEKRREAAVDEERVEVAVLVVVDPATPGPIVSGVHALSAIGALVVKVNARLSWLHRGTGRRRGL